MPIGSAFKSQKESSVFSKVEGAQNIVDFTFFDPKANKTPVENDKFKESQIAFTFKPVIDEPSYIKEYKESDTVYQIPLKLEDSEISSDGEFNDADRIQVYKEDATEVYLIEQKHKNDIYFS